MEFKADPNRVADPNIVEVGIPVRAKLDGTFEPVDIAHLDRESFLGWLRSRDDMGQDAGIQWRENVILLIFGHEQQT